MTPEEEKEFDEKVNKLRCADEETEEATEFGYRYKGQGGFIHSATDWGHVKKHFSQLLQQREKALVEKIIKMLETTDVQMSVNGDVSQDEKAMAKLIYKAHINHIKKKLQFYEK